MKGIFIILILAVLFVFGSMLISNISKAEIKEGDVAPQFNAHDENGKTVDLSDHKDKWVVLYFYPKDDTRGCTIEAKEFTELYDEFLKNNAVVYGISSDTKESHCDFRDKYKLKVPLIPDVDQKIISLYGVKTLAGYASRDTIVINPSGNIAKIYRKVAPAGHPKEVLNFIKKS